MLIFSIRWPKGTSVRRGRKRERTEDVSQGERGQGEAQRATRVRGRNRHSADGLPHLPQNNRRPERKRTEEERRGRRTSLLRLGASGLVVAVDEDAHLRHEAHLLLIVGREINARHV